VFLRQFCLIFLQDDGIIKFIRSQHLCLNFDRWESGPLADNRLKVIDLSLLRSQSPNVAVLAVWASVSYRTRHQIWIRSPPVNPEISRRPHFLQAV
jgi:hypothetical protein